MRQGTPKGCKMWATAKEMRTDRATLRGEYEGIAGGLGRSKMHGGCVGGGHFNPVGMGMGWKGATR